jgi:hypothetical protein
MTRRTPHFGVLSRARAQESVTCFASVTGLVRSCATARIFNIHR